MSLSGRSLSPIHLQRKITISMSYYALFQIHYTHCIPRNGCFIVGYYYGPPPPQETTFDVTKFGAVGDGKADDSKAFESAWEAAGQQVSDSAKITIASGKTFLLSPIKFAGPCKCHNITFEILGSIVAQPKLEWKNKRAGEWLMFQGVDRLKVVGNGQGLIDGQGDSWWGQVS
ncbi:hypothetical protein Pfo_011995 [Paulownia fortunei]|nr:hypothetical protein Pfo_011995 [Paulownia fortunei]